MMKQSSSTVHKECIGGKLICDWILENRLNCHTGSIPCLLAQLIATLIHYPFTVPLPGLADLSTSFSRASFADHANSRLRQSIGPVEGTDQWKVWIRN